MTIFRFNYDKQCFEIAKELFPGERIYTKDGDMFARPPTPLERLSDWFYTFRLVRFFLVR
jgi:hypothetical protein